ncbi:MAG: hypothetical protein IM600_01015 [Bacteroidetes bacterium]|nr:hypothetical protein [Bacteroidota bacterium]MCA6441982.1 hypothetical protein [Bacteroidota bacterium]
MTKILAQPNIDSSRFVLCFTPGLKIFQYKEVGPRFASNFGLELKKNKSRVEFFFRNYTYLFPIVPDSNSVSKIINYNTFFVFGINKYSKNKKIKYGVGIFHENNYLPSQQTLYFFPSHEAGVEFSIYSNFSWFNVSFKQKTQLVGRSINNKYSFPVVSVFNNYRFYICLEFPLKVNY